MAEPVVSARDGRRLTLIVIPHGDLETRTFEISYRKLKFGLIAAGILMLVVGIALAFWFPIAVQAGRVRGLETQVAQLEQEREKVAELEALLSEVEAQYERVRELLGADGESGDSPLLPPLRSDSGSSATSAASGDDGGPDPSPLTTAAILGRATLRWAPAAFGPDIAERFSTAMRAVHSNSTAKLVRTPTNRISQELEPRITNFVRQP